ncbi:MAG TPA: hypothetical protein DCE14_08435 [Kosmotogaceae bacterium]|nr:MAG: Uncharacterized protein XE05_0656 [Thermotogales bacterium 46_20]HAA86353.1 hypothetical protein [Kosmotogaceae bacterium]
MWFLIAIVLATFLTALIVKSRQSDRPVDTSAKDTVEDTVFEYSVHAIQRMEERDVSQERVEALLKDSSSKGFVQSGGRIRVTDGELTVIASVTGKKIVIKTVFYN